MTDRQTDRQQVARQKDLRGLSSLMSKRSESDDEDGGWHLGCRCFCDGDKPIVMDRDRKVKNRKTMMMMIELNRIEKVFA